MMSCSRMVFSETICSLPPCLGEHFFSDNCDKFFELLEIVKTRVRTIFLTTQTSVLPFVRTVLWYEMNCFYLNKLGCN